MKNYKLYAIALLGCWAATATSAEAGIFRRGCGPRCAPPSCGTPACVTPCAAVGGHYEDRVVTRTVYVREMQTEMRNVCTIVNEPEQRSRTYKVCKRVPYTETLVQEYTVMVQQTQMRTVTQTVYKPVTKNVEQTYTVMVPSQETRTGTRQVPVCEPVTLTRKVCVDRGSWQTREIQVPCGNYGYSRCGGCGGCGGCAPQYVTQCVRVWVPNLVTEEVACTVMRTKLVPQDFQYTVTVCKPEQRTRTVQVCETVAEQVTKQVPYTVCVPEKKTRTVEVTKYRDVVEEKTETFTVMVPKQVTKAVAVEVCKMVPKTVEQTIRVWVADPCGAAPAGCGNCAPAVEAAPQAAPQAAPKKPAPNPAPLPTPKPAPVKKVSALPSNGVSI